MKKYFIEKEWINTIIEESGLPITEDDAWSPNGYTRLTYPIAGGTRERRIDLNGNIEDDVIEFVDSIKKDIAEAKELLKMEIGDYEKYFCALPSCKAHVRIDKMYAKTIKVLYKNRTVEHERVKMITPYNSILLPVYYCDKCAKTLEEIGR